MDDPVDRVIEERQAMEAGFPRSVVLSLVGHAVLVGVAFAAPLLFPSGPVLQVAPGFVVPLPRGGGGASSPAAPPSAPPVVKPSQAPPEPPAPLPNRVVKPKQAAPRDALPDLDSKRRGRKAEAPLPQATQPVSRSQTAAGAGESVGLDLGGPPGVGFPDGTDVGGDWYIASVLQKVRTLWQQQLAASAMQQPAIVKLIIQADGTVTGVGVVNTSGNFTVDQAALRAVYSAAPFRELPKEHAPSLSLQFRFLPPSR